MTQNGKRRTKALRLDKDLIEANLKGIEEKISGALSQGTGDLTIDFSRVKAFDAMGLSLLVATHNTCQTSGGKLMLSNVRAEVATTMNLLGLDRHVEVRGR
jgi:anti-anti-sigma factor